jgi:hypothetical protein
MLQPGGLAACPDGSISAYSTSGGNATPWFAHPIAALVTATIRPIRNEALTALKFASANAAGKMLESLRGRFSLSPPHHIKSRSKSAAKQN